MNNSKDCLATPLSCTHFDTETRTPSGGSKDWKVWDMSTFNRLFPVSKTNVSDTRSIFYITLILFCPSRCRQTDLVWARSRYTWNNSVPLEAFCFLIVYILVKRCLTGSRLLASARRWLYDPAVLQQTMANRTVKDAHSIKGTNPQYLVEKIIRTRIYECRYWKEECFALTGNLKLN